MPSPADRAADPIMASRADDKNIQFHTHSTFTGDLSMHDETDPTRRVLLTAMTGLILPTATRPVYGQSAAPSQSPALKQGIGPSQPADQVSSIVSVKDFGAVGDGRSQDGPAFTNAAHALPRGGAIEIPEGTYLVGGQIFGPGRGNVHAYDHADIGSEEIISQPAFAGLIGHWALSYFARQDNSIFHTAKSIGRASTSIALEAYTTYLITIETTTIDPGGIAFNLAGHPIFTERDYSFLPKGKGSYNFTMFSYTNSGDVKFDIFTDNDWGGIVDNISIRRVARETPYDFFSLSADKRDFRNVSGIKFGRFLSGNIAIGDRLTSSILSEKAAWNIAIGSRSLSTNIDGFENTALGAFTLEYNQVDRNTAGGYSSFRYNTKGIQNTGWGYKTFGRNSTGSNNTGVGFWASMYNKIGGNNSSFGALSNYYNCDGEYNSAFGSQAGLQNDGGSGNTYIGAISGPYTVGAKTFSYSYTTCIGAESKCYGDNTTALGYQAQCGADPNANGTVITTTATAIGKNAKALSNDTLAVGGNSSAQSLRGTAIGDHSLAMGVDSTAIGAFTQASTESVAIGALAGLNMIGTESICIGFGSNNFSEPHHFTNVICIGHNSKSTSSDQVKLGNSRTSTIDINYASLRISADKQHQSDHQEISTAKALNVVNGLKPSSWTWKIEGSQARKSSGIVAQNLLSEMDKYKLDLPGLVDATMPNDIKIDPYALIGLLCASIIALTEKVSNLEKVVKSK